MKKKFKQEKRVGEYNWKTKGLVDQSTRGLDGQRTGGQRISGLEDSGLED